MKKIKVNRAFKVPKQEDKSISWWEYRNKVLNCKHLRTPGTVGYSGDKVHVLSVDYLDTEDGIGILSANSYCGARKMGSSVNPTFYDDPKFETVTCKKCLERFVKEGDKDE